MAQVAPIENITAAEEHVTDETDNVTAIELQRHKRVLYFSDGTLEESSDSDDNDTLDKGMELNINENDLPLISRLKCKVSKVGASLLAGIDYVGGSLASFFGITTPEYASEMEDYKHTRAEESDNDATWLSGGTSTAEVVTLDPRRDINRNTIH